MKHIRMPQPGKHLNQYLDTRFDRGITLCGRDPRFCLDVAHDGETLPRGCEDPEDTKVTEAGKPADYCRARHEIRQQTAGWPRGKAGIPELDDVQSN